MDPSSLLACLVGAEFDCVGHRVRRLPSQGTGRTRVIPRPAGRSPYNSAISGATRADSATTRGPRAGVPMHHARTLRDRHCSETEQDDALQLRCRDRESRSSRVDRSRGRCETPGVLVLAEPTNDGVRERWARALRLGLRPQSHGYPAGTSDADLNERRERLDDALREERDLLEPIVAQLATDSRGVIVADREGVILSTRADRHGIDPVARARLVAGARWGEETRGTNAIGTAIAEGRAVAVIGAAHFEERNRGIFCYATPIRDAYGELVAVLDVSGPLERHDPSIGASVQSAGLAVERALRAMAYGDRRSGAFAAIERLVHRTSGPELLVEATGVVRVVNLAARAALTLDDGQTLTCERALGISFAELVAAAAQRGGMRFETREGTWRIAVDPIAGAGDRTLAVLVHFTAEHVERAPVSPPQPSRATSPAPPASSAFAAI